MNGLQAFLVAVIGWLALLPGAWAAASQGFLIRPYLFAAGPGSIELAWQYTEEEDSTAMASVELYKGPERTATVPARRDGMLWVAELPIPVCGFGPDVAYRVDGMETPQAIAPLPCPGKGESARFSMIADAQERTDLVEQLSGEIVRFPGGSAILSGGDQVQEGSEYPEWVGFFSAIAEPAASRVLIPAVGNHEYRHPHRDVYHFRNFFQTAQHDAHYDYFIGDAHVIVLNSCFSDDRDLDRDQIPWLIHALSVPARWKLVMFHHPPFSRSIANLKLAPKKEYAVLQSRYVPLFEALGADVVLNGHTHVFERSVKRGIQYLTAGPAGGVWGYFAAKNPYFVTGGKVRTVTHFEVTERYLSAVTLDLDGRQVDAFTLKK